MLRLLLATATFLSLCLNIKCYSYDEYLFFPQGWFGFKSYASYTPDSFTFKNGILYAIQGSHRIPAGSVEKLSAWTPGYVFKLDDLVLCTYHSPLFSVGTCFDYLKEYEIYDENNQVIGYIKGAWDADNAAHFFFYKEEQEPFAEAVLDLSRSNLRITTADDQTLITAVRYLNMKSYSIDNEYYWKIKKEKGETFNTCFLWPFIAFLSAVWWY
jgi:hypothetical protein